MKNLIDFFSKTICYWFGVYRFYVMFQWMLDHAQSFSNFQEMSIKEKELFFTYDFHLMHESLIHKKKWWFFILILTMIQTVFITLCWDKV